MQVEFRLLEYFVTVSQELHFTKAAEKLGISQPTLSQQIRLLEAQLGTPLFSRAGKKVRLTYAGNILLEHCSRIFFELDQVSTKIKDVRGILRGKLSIGCSGGHLLTSPVLSFHEKYPGIELSIIDLRTKETYHRLLQNQLDLGVTFLMVEDNRLETIPLFEEEFYLVVSHLHELAEIDSIKLKDLQTYPLTLLPHQFTMRHFFEEESQKMGFTIQPRIEFSTVEALLQLVKKNHDLATILPRSYLSTIHDDKIRQVQISDRDFRKMIGIVYKKDLFIDNTMDAFIKQLIKTYKKV
jgi:LysR family transcriptional regulator, cyn operon transcriptional activator